jgi:hypothetical protein
MSSIQQGLRTGREAGTVTGAADDDAGNGLAIRDGVRDGNDGRGMR